MVAEYSAFSGLVTEVIVGSSRARVTVALAFTAHRSDLFDPGMCPAFADCFDSTSSCTAAIDYLHENGFGMTETVILNQQELRMKLFVVDSSVAETVLFREVAGVFGANKASSTFPKDTLLILKRIPGTTHKVSISYASALPSSFFAVQTVAGESWEFPAMVRITDGSPSVTRVRFDPSAQELVLPLPFAELVRQAAAPHRVRVDETGLMYTECTLLGTSKFLPTLFLDLLDGNSIEIPGMVSLLVPNFAIRSTIVLHTPSVSLCATRIRFSAAEHVVIGRQLLESVASVSLDLARGAIGFELRTEPIRHTFHSAPALVPVFGEPEVVSLNRETEILLRRRDRGLLLLSRQPERISETMRQWRFLRTDPATDSVLSVASLPDLYSTVELVVSNDYVRFELTRAPTGRLSVSLVSHGSSFVVSVQERLGEHAGGELELPMPSSATAAADCAICLDLIDIGDQEQRMHACTHRFHSHCIRKWLDERKRDCPVCRAVVRTRRLDTEQGSSAACCIS